MKVTPERSTVVGLLRLATLSSVMRNSSTEARSNSPRNSIVMPPSPELRTMISYTNYTAFRYGLWPAPNFPTIITIALLDWRNPELVTVYTGVLAEIRIFTYFGVMWSMEVFANLYALMNVFLTAQSLRPQHPG